ncbi:50S ribosomal protein L35 [bacterium]|nr:50S ribosomal protein L35 [bacterium]
MPKLKTNKTLMSRVKVTPNGKLVRKRAFSAHLRSKKTSAARARTGAKKVDSIRKHPWVKLLQG